MTNSKKTFKSIKLNMFFFFLLLAIIFWALTKFSKENTAKITANVYYNNVPENYLLGDDNSSEISFDITSNGFDFLIYKIKKPTVTLDVSKYFSEETKQAIVGKDALKEEIGLQINYKDEIRNINKSSIQIQLQGIQSKKVPVLIQFEGSYGEGFRPTDSIHAEPDSVLVLGPNRFLDSITGVPTTEVIINNIQKNISKEVNLLPLGYSQLTTKTKKVVLRQEVKEFAQKKISLPVTVKNVPNGIALKLIPTTVTITCVVPIEHFAMVTKKDFKVVCDYAERNSEENFLTPILEESPIHAKNVEILPKKIDFLIFK
jgi:hypothetical protein